MRIQINLLVDVHESVTVERLLLVVSTFVKKSPKLEVISLTGREVQAPGRPAEVRSEILSYMRGRKPKTAHQIARGINRTDRSVYKPLHALKEEGLMEHKRHPKFPAMQWSMVKGAQEDSGSVEG